MESAGPSTETQPASQSSQESPKKVPKHVGVKQNKLTHSPLTAQPTNGHSIGHTSTTPTGDSHFNFPKNISNQTQNKPNVFEFGNNNTDKQNKPGPSYHLNDPSIISLSHHLSTSTSPTNNHTQNATTPTKSLGEPSKQNPAVALQNGLVPTKTLTDIKITVRNDQRSIQTMVQQREVPKPFQINFSQLPPLTMNSLSSKQPQFKTQTSQSRPFAFDTQGYKQPQFQAQASQSRPFAFDTQSSNRPQFQAHAAQSRMFALATQCTQRPQFQAQTFQSQGGRLPKKAVVSHEPVQPSWRGKKPYYYEEQDVERKVIVTGFPAYTQSQELTRKLSVLGTPKVEICKNRVAVVMFKSEAEVAAALRANDTIPMYGAILSILKYTHRNHVLDMIRQNKRVVRNEHKGPPVAEPSAIDLSGHFQQQLQNLEDAIRLTPAEVEAIGPLFHDIETYLRPLHPDCQAVPFGSITTGQGIKSSDADCFLSLEPGENGQPGAGAAEHSSHFVSGAVRVLRQHKHIFTNLISIPRANTPIIKFLHVPTNINCDLNSKTPLGVQNSRLVGHLLRLDPRLGSAALVLKYWARVHQLSGTGRLTNYALVMLLIHYLQQSLLPPVADLQGPAHRFIVESWNAGFDSSPLPYLREVPPVKDLLGGFFLYYSAFNFEELVVSPLLGKPLKKADFEKKTLPEAMELYLRNISSGLAYPLRTGCVMCVQDPFELSHNVASAVSGKLAADIRANLKWAAAAYVQPEKTPGDFLRNILLSGPPPDEFPDVRLGMRLSLPRGLLVGLGGDDEWREVARSAVLDRVYRDILMLPLERRAAVSRENVELEVYVGTLTRPVWRRSVHGNARVRNAQTLTTRHRLITEEIARGPAPDVHVPFEVELGFSEAPRLLTVTTSAMDGADLEAFRLFRIFSHNFIFRWCKILLTPDTGPDSNAAPDKPTTQQTKPAKKNFPKNTKPEASEHNSPEETSDGNKSSSPEGETSNSSSEISSQGSRESKSSSKVPKSPGKRKASKQNSPAQGTPERRVGAPVQIASVAFVNSQHKEIGESLAAVRLNDALMQNVDDTS